MDEEQKKAEEEFTMQLRKAQHTQIQILAKEIEDMETEEAVRYIFNLGVRAAKSYADDMGRDIPVHRLSMMALTQRIEKWVVVPPLNK